MNSLEAALHYGMTRSDPPTSGQIRDQFFAVVVAGENQGSGYHQEMAAILMLAYRLTWEHEREDEDEPPSMELLNCKEAEQVFQKAYRSVYCPGEEIPDGMGWFDFVPYRDGLLYPKCLIVDAGHLLAHFERAQEKQFTAYIQSEEGKRRMREMGVPCE